ncbi:4'-phosphopantetheinyl transferase superfamily protein [Methylocystis sp. 9N]|uniref:4'-phosphopantetheinyl transferase superfamily protein n=1 Tax=Methylocystis borbori TaxID=3118750 RepID=A0ABU7XKK4_9HYPH
MRHAPPTANVDVACLDVAAVGADEWSGLAALLDESERARAARFAFETDRRAYIGAHALLRVLLSRRAHVAPGDWRFASAPFGKPYLVSPPRDLAFNLSHTRGMAAVAVAEAARDIGVDVEALAQTRDVLRVAERFFAPDEAAAIRAATALEARNDLFFSIWTLKEAVVKAEGCGLSRGLDSFVVSLSPLRITGAADERFSLGQWRRRGFCVAAAARGEDVAFSLEEETAAALLAESQSG